MSWKDKLYDIMDQNNDAELRKLIEENRRNGIYPDKD